MSEAISSLDYMQLIPNHEERARLYFGDALSAGEKETAIGLAEAFQDKERHMSNTAVLIPVAAHQDSSHIIPALSEYANQRNHEPFTIFLHLNAPLDKEDTAGIEKSLVAVEEAKQLFPNLDIRSSMTHYDNPKIGEIRDDLWNAVLLLAYHESKLQPGKDVIGINHDIDTIQISPHYMSRVQKYYQRKQAKYASINAQNVVVPPAGTLVKHANFDTHPNVAKVTQWIDNTYFQSPGHVWYEASMVIPFSWYTVAGGFDRSAETHETHQLSTGKHLPVITSAQLKTSPRRYIDRLAEHGTRGIWLPGTFGPEDACRETLPSDISSDQAEDLILERLDEDIREHWLSSATHDLVDIIADDPSLTLNGIIDITTERVNRQLAKAERFLRHIVRSNILADILVSDFNSKRFIETRALLEFALASTDFAENNITTIRLTGN